ncbi:hypothetical protein JT26_00355 [Porphyromonas sp. COT-108 OH1349]|nr:hypothetical protein JT26_00355 [Porphyromonas sp. COT-108 OH1349]
MSKKGNFSRGERSWFENELTKKIPKGKKLLLSIGEKPRLFHFSMILSILGFGVSFLENWNLNKNGLRKDLGRISRK